MSQFSMEALSELLDKKQAVTTELIKQSAVDSQTLIKESANVHNQQIETLTSRIKSGLEAVRSEMHVLDRKSGTRISALENLVKGLEANVAATSKEVEQLAAAPASTHAPSSAASSASSAPCASSTTEGARNSSGKRLRSDGSEAPSNMDVDKKDVDGFKDLLPPTPPPREPHPDDVVSPERRGLGGAINDGSPRFCTLKLGGDWKDEMSKAEGLTLAKAVHCKLCEFVGKDIKVKIYVNKKERGLDTSLVFPTRTLAFQALDAARMETDGPLPVNESSVYISMQKVGSALEKERKLKRAVASLRHVLGVPDSGTKVVKGDFRRNTIKFVKDADIVVGKLVENEGQFNLVCQTTKLCR